MYLMEKAVLDLLKDNVSCPVVRRLKPIDQTPCITIYQASDTVKHRDYILKGSEKIRIQKQAEIWINIWCNTNGERDTLINEVNSLFYKALANHYSLCVNYHDKQCNTTNKPCEGIGTPLNQCPDKQGLNYASWFKQHHIIKHSFVFGEEHNQDEYDTKQPILRTIIKARPEYYDYYDIGGIEYEKMKTSFETE